MFAPCPLEMVRLRCRLTHPTKFGLLSSSAYNMNVEADFLSMGSETDCPEIRRH